MSTLDKMIRALINYRKANGYTRTIHPSTNHVEDEFMNPDDAYTHCKLCGEDFITDEGHNCNRI